MISIEQLALFMLVLSRVSAFVAFFPLFSKKQLPTLVKLGLASSLSIFWFCEIDASSDAIAHQVAGAGAMMVVLLIVKEVTIGVALAMILGAFFLPARVAGSYVGQELGLSLASISDPASQDSSTLVTRLFETFAILIFFALNLHHFLIMVIHFSFKHLFAQSGPLMFPTEQIVTGMNGLTDYGLLIVAPLMIIFMLVTLILAFLNRAAPSLNLFSVGMSIRAGLGVFCLFLFAPVLFGALQTYMYRIQEDIEGLLSVML